LYGKKTITICDDEIDLLEIFQVALSREYETFDSTLLSIIVYAVKV
jgi:hypothetical protein